LSLLLLFRFNFFFKEFDMLLLELQDEILSFLRGDNFNLLFENIFLCVGETFSLNSKNSAVKCDGENKFFDDPDNGDELILLSEKEISSSFLLPLEKEDVEYLLCL